MFLHKWSGRTAFYVQVRFLRGVFYVVKIGSDELNKCWMVPGLREVSRARVQGLTPYSWKCCCKCPYSRDSSHHQTNTNYFDEKIWSPSMIRSSQFFFFLIYHQSLSLSVHATAVWKTSAYARKQWKKGISLIKDCHWVSLCCRKGIFYLETQSIRTACKWNERILLLLPIQEDSSEGIKQNQFFMLTTGRTGNNEHRPQQGRLRLEIRKNFLSRKDPGQGSSPSEMLPNHLQLTCFSWSFESLYLYNLWKPLFSCIPNEFHDMPKGRDETYFCY